MTINVDFVSRVRLPDDDEWATPKVPHPDWCIPSECDINFDGVTLHTRVVGRVADTTIAVKQWWGDGKPQSMVELYVSGHGVVGLTAEQVPLLVEAIKDGVEFIATSCSSAVPA